MIIITGWDQCENKHTNAHPVSTWYIKKGILKHECLPNLQAEETKMSMKAISDRRSNMQMEINAVTKPAVVR